MKTSVWSNVIEELEVDVREARWTESSRAAAAAERTRFEFANAQLWADLRDIETAMAVQRGVAA